MRSALTHGVLLAAALIAALATWTSDGEPSGDAQVVVWEREPEEVAAVSFRSGERSVEIERREQDGGEPYLWGRETSPTPQPMGPSTDSAAPSPPPVRVDEYPLGQSGETVVERLARLSAIRDLGPSDDEKRATFGLSGTEPGLTVRFDDGSERTLVFGSEVAGGGARYMLDVEGRHIYVVPPDVIIAFEGGAGSLRLTNYQAFRPDDVTSVTVRAGTVERTMNRRMVDSPPRPVWTPTDSETPDVAFGNFLTQLDALWVERYDPSVAMISLESILRAEYRDWRGGSLGYIELFRGRAADGSSKYYMRTPKTIVVGEIYAGQGQLIDQDIQTLFRPTRSSAQG